MDRNVFRFPCYLCTTFTGYLTFWRVVVIGVAIVPCDYGVSLAFSDAVQRTISLGIV